VGSATAAESPISIEAKMARGELEVRYQGRKLLVYAFATNQFKPYVRELYTLRGDNVLRDAPPDHLHHHGLMYAVCVNGINFWEERGAAGIQQSVTLPWQDRLRPGWVQFRQVVHWVAPTNTASPLLVENRVLSLKVDESSQEVALRWDSFFTARQAVKIHGPNYDGLGLRLPESFNHVAKFQNSADAPYSANHTQDVIPARWTSVSGIVDGRQVVLVMFGRKNNAGGDTSFFTMLDPFAYLSATQALDKRPLEYKAGEEFTLSYLLTVYSEPKSLEFINRRGELWQKERR
jgi:hypothetical protein